MTTPDELRALLAAVSWDIRPSELDLNRIVTVVEQWNSGLRDLAYDQHGEPYRDRFRNQMDAATDIITRAEAAERERDRLRAGVEALAGDLWRGGTHLIAMHAELLDSLAGDEATT